ncbi:MAG: hypothetical protein GY719_16205 [bacterium]|nr:hypothetical protein [bacterium]
MMSYHPCMDQPEYLLCINCETPCYTFEWVDLQVKEAVCTVCGADDPDDFITEEDFEAMTSAG